MTEFETAQIKELAEINRSLIGLRTSALGVMVVLTWILVALGVLFSPAAHADEMPLPKPVDPGGCTHQVPVPMPGSPYPYFVTFPAGSCWKDVSAGRTWHLLTQTNAGTMQLVKDLDRHECEFMMHRAKGEPATDEERAAEKRRKDAEAAERNRIKVEEDAFCAANPEGRKTDDFNRTDFRCHEGKVAGWGSWGSWGSFAGSSNGGSGTLSVLYPGGIKTAECFQ